MALQFIQQTTKLITVAYYHNHNYNAFIEQYTEDSYNIAVFFKMNVL